MAARETIMKRISRTAGGVALLLTICLTLLVAIRPAVASSPKTITCPYLQAEDLRIDVPANLGDLPTIDFDYPAKVTIFSFETDIFSLSRWTKPDSSRLRVVISAQLDQLRGTYDGQFAVDMGGNQLQVDSGPVSCRVGRRQHKNRPAVRSNHRHPLQKARCGTQPAFGTERHSLTFNWWFPLVAALRCSTQPYAGLGSHPASGKAGQATM